MPREIRKLLVANRGEIAVRIFRACRELGIVSVAVFSEADVAARHVREADEAYAIGGSAASDSYLNVRNIVAAIGDSGADAVHPGYGFLSESPAFARAVREAGAVWVGPSAEAMEALGLKVEAKRLAERAGVPTVPGYAGSDASERKFAEEAQRIGYPVLVKASAGGGGRGMRVVREAGELPEAVRAARREAEAAFSDGTVFLEKLVERPRHVEVQVIGDEHGGVLHLYERECSIQRRHQKVIEEAPSPALSPELRERICASAVRLAREAAYTNAGTVEFLLSENGEFYFLEMNTRLQVEHPVTEAVTGLDLVRLQLAVAAGERLPVRQEEVHIGGAAIEARVYAEDEGGFPAGGRLLAFDPPEGTGIRNDSGVETGDEVPLFYDAMISKLIVHAPDRERAVERLREALSEYVVLGSPTNLPLLRSIASRPAFARGETRTDFLQREGLLGDAGFSEPPDEAFALAAVAEVAAPRPARDPFEAGPWRTLGLASLRYLADGGERRVEVHRGAEGFEASVRGESYAVRLLSRLGERAYLTVDGLPARVGVGERSVTVSLEGEEFEVRRVPPPVPAGGGSEAGAEGLVAPMPGTVVSVNVEEGEQVREGQLLLVLEAMKMEQPVTAPHDGTVVSLPYGKGDLVSGGDVLVEVLSGDEGRGGTGP
ncbi:Acetyl/propionyl-CoA carboxylase alpha subunit [Rubrobacter radiotolerans]|uniref:Biotin-dependent 3-methylcrotonyl-coenzyme A carboxylase alpha1 subunit n=1 Tax=Rubrobacter radiotolerans TaxID=42256 RepID=A0A023X4H7_RUBRA|nr:biotin carboxylase N-terminal domain-containing protein [Rubrobacter radiotolerans]AHY46910.1 Acetyl/propionyl-CoA carboxylase alpha subunit [Rubrobacter radiotolerans]MDX5894315.1 biotin carboxylase N-terminal domain-containing protein [Rubrobacter radiotolerans]SMC05718.1 3-methylcrotonyl-CoA carboxylase alpha subunit [Rubrobacter radiotolerans DSM 5868]